MTCWHVFRRLPGTQGRNDCWARVWDGREIPGVFDAETADEAIEAAALCVGFEEDYFAVRADCVSEMRFVRFERDPAPPPRVVLRESVG